MDCTGTRRGKSDLRSSSRLSILTSPLPSMSVRSEPLSRTKSGKLSENARLPDEGEKGLQTRSGRTVKLSEKARGAECEKLMCHGKHSKSVGAYVGQADRSPSPAASDVRSTARPVVYEDDVVVNMPGPTQLTVIHKGPSSKAGSRASKAGSTSKTGSRTSSRDSARREFKQAELRLRQEEERAKIEKNFNFAWNRRESFSLFVGKSNV